MDKVVFKDCQANVSNVVNKMDLLQQNVMTCAGNVLAPQDAKQSQSCLMVMMFFWCLQEQELPLRAMLEVITKALLDKEGLFSARGHSDYSDTRSSRKDFDSLGMPAKDVGGSSELPVRSSRKDFDSFGAVAKDNNCSWSSSRHKAPKPGPKGEEVSSFPTLPLHPRNRSFHGILRRKCWLCPLWRLCSNFSVWWYCSGKQ